ncbi:hypothetical protein IMG5_045900 [Ichthyophthirius multifiliis]|uniref:Ion transport domain-containing protein n=1 Tax=Ichthyophthirius multifiliis TaxID=5932 RepID=G0QM72_ICHMU|nr:hypothetical protein IMG5_045900 [Ichthyophthirius multifiliis]EGR33675.1 hypothetical protein IMG5_045900 [Ichthyophthirius multifiliis]|eukprot:XP_004037661.1 hypothetical protein IMG5_045900 [Ichthyophthirius multifiliis]
MLLMIGCFMYVGAVIGMWLFAGKLMFNEKGLYDQINGKSPRLNFNTIQESLTTIFVLLSGDQYNIVWNNCVRAVGGSVSHPYFVIFMIVGKIIFLNSFIAIIISSFDLQSKKIIETSKQSQIQEFKQSQDYFKKNFKKNILIMQQDKYIYNFIYIYNYKYRNNKLNKYLIIQMIVLALFSIKILIQEKNVNNQLQINTGIYRSWVNNKNKRTISIFIFLNKNIFLVLILFSSIILAFDNPLDDPNSTFKYFLLILDILSTTLFCLEAIIQIIAQGFILNYSNNKYSYIRNIWNLLDFTIITVKIKKCVCVFFFIFFKQKKKISLMNFFDIFEIKQLKSIKSLRALRALRPLRVIQRNQSLKLLVNGLFQTIPILVSLVLTSGIIIWIISIFLVDRFKGGFHYCNLQSQEIQKKIQTKQDCQDQQGEWRNFFLITTIYQILLQIWQKQKQKKQVFQKIKQQRSLQVKIGFQQCGHLLILQIQINSQYLKITLIIVPYTFSLFFWEIYTV